MEQFTPKDFEIYDMHAHIFPDKISEKATLSIGKFYDLTMAYAIGDTTHLLEAEAQIHTKRMLVCSVATTPKQVVSINNYIKVLDTFFIFNLFKRFVFFHSICHFKPGVFAFVETYVVNVVTRKGLLWYG